MMIRSVLFGSALAMLVACGGKGESSAAGAPAAPAAPAAPVAAEPAAPPAKPIELTTKLDIGAAVMAKDPDDTGWKGITIAAPEGAKIDASGGGTSLVITDQMAVGLGGENDLAEEKKKAQEDGLQKFVKLIVDAPDAILWEAEGPNFLFVANVKLGDKVKGCETNGYGTFTRQAAEKLLEACRGMTRAE